MLIYERVRHFQNMVESVTICSAESTNAHGLTRTARCTSTKLIFEASVVVVVVVIVVLSKKMSSHTPS